eukprot:gene25328-31772_t
MRRAAMAQPSALLISTSSAMISQLLASPITTRVPEMTQLEEILVSKLIGATDTFIHRPFYYTGALLGLCAGGVALGAVALALQPLNKAIAEFARLYASEFQLAALEPLPMAALLAVSAVLGLIGAVLSVQRHLARLN